MFEGIGSKKLKGYAVWEPILRTDNVRGARKATTILPDSRVTCGGTDIAENVPPGQAASVSMQSARPLSAILGDIASETKPF